MTRNLDRRVEVSVPIHDPLLQSQLAHCLEDQLKDNVRARSLDASMKNTFVKGRKNQPLRDSQSENVQTIRGG